MASVSNDRSGGKRVLFQWKEDRRVIHLAKGTTRKIANGVKDKIEALISMKKNSIVDPDVSGWLAGLSDDLYAKIAAIGMAEPRLPTTPVELPTMGKLHAEIFAAMHVKPGTMAAHKQGADSLLDYFGASMPLRDINALAADKWQQSLHAEGLAEATISKRTQTAKMMFRRAVTWEMIAKNPFEALKLGSQKNKARQFFVTRDVTQKVIDACPDAEWKLIVALARYGGLRTPSEHLALKWGDIDFEHGRIRVTSPKTAHHKGRGERFCPLFPELRPLLLAAFSEAPEGAEWVINRYRKGNTNLRTQLKRIMARAGVTPWDRLFQNLRASRATELADEYPGHVAAAWLGHTEEVADSHYRMMLDGHFAKAIAEPSGQVAQFTAQHPPEQARNDEKLVGAMNEKSPDFPGLSEPCEALLTSGMGVLGFEPRTKGL